MQTPQFDLNRRQFLHGVLGSAAFSSALYAAGSEFAGKTAGEGKALVPGISFRCCAAGS